MTAEAYRQSDYRSYLLRLWRADGDKEPVWRASLEDAVSGERRGFASVEALAAFLLQSVREQGEAQAVG